MSSEFVSIQPYHFLARFGGTLRSPCLSSWKSAASRLLAAQIPLQGTGGFFVMRQGFSPPKWAWLNRYKFFTNYSWMACGETITAGGSHSPA